MTAALPESRVARRIKYRQSCNQMLRTSANEGYGTRFHEQQMNISMLSSEDVGSNCWVHMPLGNSLQVGRLLQVKRCT